MLTSESLEIFIRLLYAFAAGGIIGYQREKAEKPAGLRTHILVCLGSTLITIVSIFAFGKMGADPSRITAQIVSGVGFLGAGTIFRYGPSVKGLTTAASLWAVCGVGIAIGAGVYFAAFLGVVFILLVLVLLELFEQRMRTKNTSPIRVLLTDVPGSFGRLGEALGKMGVNIKNVKIMKDQGLFIHCDLWLEIPSTQKLQNVLMVLGELDVVKGVELE
ncbi:MAG: MgtC/SapB family protein [Candidatus Atribacteria bacterium]|nr:MgtC/SapB family protein [Candidatus Atribacteria bacterium]